MGANFGAFFNNDNADLFAALLGDLAQATSRGKPGGASTDDDHVYFHRFAFHSLLLGRIRRS
jgi:hypothetical protein